MTIPRKKQVTFDNDSGDAIAPLSFRYRYAIVMLSFCYRSAISAAIVCFLQSPTSPLFYWGGYVCTPPAKKPCSRASWRFFGRLS